MTHLQQGSAIDDGEGVDVGAMISGQGAARLEHLINEAVRQGARLVHGGSRYRHPKYPQGHYFKPTLLVDVTKDMQIAQEELFAPVALLMKVQTIDEAIDVANSTIYGLGGAVFGSNEKDVNKVINGVETVGMAVNDFAVFYVCQLPFGGTKGSGYGRFMGIEGLRALCNVKVSFWQNYIHLIVKVYMFRPISLCGSNRNSWRCRLSDRKCGKSMAICSWAYVFCIWSYRQRGSWWSIRCSYQSWQEDV